MASVTRVNGALTALDTDYYPGGIQYIQIQILGVDMTAEADLEGGALEAIIKVMNPLAYRCKVQGGNTYIFAIIDGAFSNDLGFLEDEIQRLGSSVGPNSVDVSGATVAVKLLD